MVLSGSSIALAHSAAIAAQSPSASGTPRNRSPAKAANIYKASVFVRFLGEYPSLSTIRKPLFMHRKTYGALLSKLRQIETNSERRKYKGKRLTECTLKPTSMYQVEVAHIADV